MICKVNGDLTGRLVQHENCDHSDEMQQFFLGFLKRIQSWDLQSTPLFLLSKQLTRRQKIPAEGAGVALLLRFPCPGLRGDIVVLLQS